MSISDIIQILVNGGIEYNEAAIEVKMMIEHYCNYTALDVIKGKKLDNEKLKIVKEKAFYRVKTHQPVQYILGFAYFMQNKFIVNENVLIPRGDTEQLVIKALDLIRSNNLKTVLDIGTGSGCIACSVAKYTDTDVLGVDISDAALKIASKNAKELNLTNRVKFKKSDIFSDVKDKFDLIISNPPYIPLGTELQTEVQKEPQIALFADEGGMEFYIDIIKSAKEYLNPNGFIAFELGIGLSDKVYKLLEDNCFNNIMIEKDMENHDRIIFAQIN